MAHKIVGTGITVAVSTGSSVASGPISLQSGYLRIATTAASHVSVASTSGSADGRLGYLIPSAGSVVLKDRVASTKVSAATTGTSTVYYLRANSGNPFLTGDYVTVTNSSVSDYNCTHMLVSSTNETPGSESITVTLNTSSAASFTGTADVRRSVVVNTFGNAAGYAQISQVQITSEA